jgi:hypothetical protein
MRKNSHAPAFMRVCVCLHKIAHIYVFTCAGCKRVCMCNLGVSARQDLHFWVVIRTYPQMPVAVYSDSACVPMRMYVCMHACMYAETLAAMN